MLINKKIKAFTIMELLISMTLTGILIVFSFMGYNQIQKLFINYAIQNKFITDYNQLNKALYLISDKAIEIEKMTDHLISFKSDSATVFLEIKDKTLLLKFKAHTDTFDLESKKNTFSFLKLNNETPSNLIENFDCEVFFHNQKFKVSFHKEYDAVSVLTKNLELYPPNEFN
jgi:hypothetical protein